MRTELELGVDVDGNKPKVYEIVSCIVAKLSAPNCELRIVPSADVANSEVRRKIKVEYPHLRTLEEFAPPANSLALETRRLAGHFTFHLLPHNTFSRHHHRQRLRIVRSPLPVISPVLFALHLIRHAAFCGTKRAAQARLDAESLFRLRSVAKVASLSRTRESG